MNIIYDFDSFLKSPMRSANFIYLDAFQNFVNELIVQALIVFHSDEFFWMTWGDYTLATLLADAESGIWHILDMLCHVKLYQQLELTLPRGSAKWNAKMRFIPSKLFTNNK